MHYKAVRCIYKQERQLAQPESSSGELQLVNKDLEGYGPILGLAVYTDRGSRRLLL